MDPFIHPFNIQAPAPEPATLPGAGIYRTDRTAGEGANKPTREYQVQTGAAKEKGVCGKGFH